MTDAATSGRPFGLSAVRDATKRFNLTYNLFANCSIPLTWVIANYSAVSANSLTRIGGLSGLAGSALLWSGRPGLAALCFAIFLLLDCSDGAVARLKGQADDKGAAIDLFWDRAVLFVAILSRCAVLSGVNLLLCVGYLCLHYATDLGWLMRLDEQSRRPAQWQALVTALTAQSPPRASGWAPMMRWYRALKPDVWVCNIAFLMLPCLLPDAPNVSYGVAFALLAFTTASAGVEPMLRRRLGPAR